MKFKSTLIISFFVILGLKTSAQSTLNIDSLILDKKDKYLNYRMFFSSLIATKYLGEYRDSNTLNYEIIKELNKDFGTAVFNKVQSLGLSIYLLKEYDSRIRILVFDFPDSTSAATAYIAINKGKGYIESNSMVPLKINEYQSENVLIYVENLDCMKKECIEIMESIYSSCKKMVW